MQQRPFVVVVDKMVGRPEVLGRSELVLFVEHRQALSEQSTELELFVERRQVQLEARMELESLFAGCRQVQLEARTELEFAEVDKPAELGSVEVDKPELAWLAEEHNHIAHSVLDFRQQLELLLEW